MSFPNSRKPRGWWCEAVARDSATTPFRGVLWRKYFDAGQRIDFTSLWRALAQCCATVAQIYFGAMISRAYEHLISLWRKIRLLWRKILFHFGALFAQLYFTLAQLIRTR